jgi:hypothetical protein
MLGRLLLLLLRELGIDALGAERDTDLCWRVGIDDQDVDFLKVLEEGVEVLEMESTTCVVPAKFTLSIKNVECVDKRAAVTVG